MPRSRSATRATNTSTGTGPAAFEQPAQLVGPGGREGAHDVAVADGVVGALRIGGQLHQPGLAVGRAGAHGKVVAAHGRHGDDGSRLQGAHHLARSGAHQRRTGPAAVVHALPTAQPPARTTRARAARPGRARPAPRRSPAAGQPQRRPGLVRRQLHDRPHRAGAASPGLAQYRLHVRQAGRAVAARPRHQGLPRLAPHLGGKARPLVSLT